MQNPWLSPEAVQILILICAITQVALQIFQLNY